jgi:hypothetical protein
LAQHVVLVDAERTAHRMELLDEQIRCPEVGRGVGQMGAVAAPDLVVVDDGPAGLGGQPGDVAHVVVRHSRATMQDEQGQGAIAGLVGRGDLHPGLVFAEWNQPCRTSHGAQHGPRKGLMARPLIAI